MTVECRLGRHWRHVDGFIAPVTDQATRHDYLPDNNSSLSQSNKSLQVIKPSQAKSCQLRARRRRAKNAFSPPLLNVSAPVLSKRSSTGHSTLSNARLIAYLSRFLHSPDHSCFRIAKSRTSAARDFVGPYGYGHPTACGLALSSNLRRIEKQQRCQRHKPIQY